MPAAWSTIVVLQLTAFAVFGQDLRTTRTETYLTLFHGSRPLLQYRHDSRPFKPYVKELFSPKGVQILRDAPADHYHHHGLMYAIGVDGVTFWSEEPSAGVQRGAPPTDVTVRSIPGVAQAQFEHALEWLAPDSSRPTLAEQRTLHAYVVQGLPCNLVTWRSRLTTGAGRDRIQLSGSHYYGLGMRFAQWMDTVGMFLSATGEAGKVFRGDERLVAAKWVAYVCPDDRQPVTVALFDHPRNVRHPATMFTMRSPFAYLSATLNLQEEPMTLEAGETLDLVYGIAVWDGQRHQDDIEAAYREWLKLVENVAAHERHQQHE